MNPNFNPIQTRYSEHLFRSRLEARWAVFFNHLSIKWKYEWEGYSFDNYTYLPDFYFTDFDYYAEVKPDNKERVDFFRWRSFVTCSKKSLLMLYGLPNASPTILINEPEHGGVCDTVVPFANFVREKFGLFYGSDTVTFNDNFREAIRAAKEYQFEFKEVRKNLID
jgi:hypothetical protein